MAIQANNPSNSRRAGLDLMKFLFALLIMLHHTRQLFTQLSLFEGLYIGVDFFFLTSGMLMARSAEKCRDHPVGTATAGFLSRRLRLLFPCYLIAYLFYFLLVQWLGPTSLNHVLRDLICSIPGFLLLEMAGFSTGVALPGSWFLSALLLAQMLLYPFLLWKKTDFAKTAAPLIGLFLLGYLSKNFGCLGNPADGTALVCKGLIEAIALLSLGIFCNTLLPCPGIAALSPGKRQSLLAANFIFVLTIGTLRGKSQLDFVLIPFLMGITILSYGLDLPPAVERASRFLGKLSYPLYLTHFCIIYLLNNLLPGAAPWPKAVLFILGSVGTAFLCIKAGDRLSVRIEHIISPSVSS